MNRATIVPARGVDPAPLVVLLNPNPPIRRPVAGNVVVVAAKFVELGLGSEYRLKMFVNSARIWKFVRSPIRKTRPMLNFSVGLRG